MVVLFDYRQLARRLAIPADRLDELHSRVRADYGDDDMMVELRMMRTLQAIEKGAATIDSAVREFSGQPVQDSHA